MKTTAKVCLLLALFAVSLHAEKAGPIGPIETGYGADGEYRMVRASFDNPAKKSYKVYVFRPKGLKNRPTIFFAHGFGGIDPQYYMSLIRHVVSRGYVVVYPSYPALQSSGDRYDIIFTGFEEAAQRFSKYIDTTRVGFMGHSYGGGATPSMAYRGIVENGWGANGAFLFPMAPWYSFDITDAELQAFSDGVLMIMQVYDEDRTCDQRMAIDIFNSISIPAKDKDYHILYSDSSAEHDYVLSADHLTPCASPDPLLPLFIEDGLDYYGIWRPLDALCAYLWEGKKTARKYALGGGRKLQRYMGKWPAPDGSRVKRKWVGDDPQPTQEQSYYSWRWDSFLNPRN